MTIGAAWRFGDTESGNLAAANVNTLDAGINVYHETGLNVGVTAGRVQTAAGPLDYAGSVGVALAPSTANQALYLSAAGTLVAAGAFPAEPAAEFTPLAEVDTGATDDTAIRDKRCKLTTQDPARYSSMVSIAFAASPYAVLGEDVLLVDATGGNVVVDLPPAITKRRITVKKTDVSANTVTLTPGGSDSIGDGATVLTTQYEVTTVQSDGELTWWVV